MTPQEKANRLLKALWEETSSFGEWLTLNGRVYEKMLAYSNSADGNEILSLLAYLKKDSLIDIPLSAEKATITMDGYKHLEMLSESTENFLEAFPGKSFDKTMHEALREQLEKAKEKLARGDYTGVITNCYTLMEGLLKELLKKTKDGYKETEGNIKKLYGQLSDSLDLSPEGENLESCLKPILQGLLQQIVGLYNLANKASDRHARIYNPTHRHAKLALNATSMLCEFLLESYEYQKKQLDNLGN